MTLSPAYQTATHRRELRRHVRNALGTSSDPAPEAVSALRAAADMVRLVDEATNGCFDLILIDRKDRCVSFAEALKFSRDTDQKPKPAGAVVLTTTEMERLHELLDHVPQGVLNQPRGQSTVLNKIGYGS